MLTIGFYGATQTVTGSKFLLRHQDARVLVDCGLFQGYKQLRRRNWAPLPFAVDDLDAVVLTHAHIDHSGALPRLVRQGYAGSIHATPATAALCRILLPDSGRIQEADAHYANRKGFSKHRPAEPLYTEVDARKTLGRLRGHGFDTPFEVAPGMTASFSRAGHILGASSVRVQVAGRSVVFSGDLGRPGDRLICAPDPRPDADYVVLEATYGNRRHGAEDPADVLADIIQRTIAREGTVVIPAFSVGRTQSILLMLLGLFESGRLPRLPVFLDSPMAISATELYRAHPQTHRLDAEACARMCEVAEYARTVEQSKALDAREDSFILISASGMATGGRVIHHLKRFGPDARNTILFAGFQAGGTRGAKLVAGAERVRIHGQWVPIAAEVANLDMLSAHADQDELLAWLASNDRRPKQVFVVHAEPEAAEHLRVRIVDELGWDCEVPTYRERFEL